MTATFELSPAEKKSIREELVLRLMKEHCEEIQTVSPAQAAGILDISIKSLWDIPDLPRIEVTERIIKYRISDIREWMSKHRKFPGQ